MIKSHELQPTFQLTQNPEVLFEGLDLCAGLLVHWALNAFICYLCLREHLQDCQWEANITRGPHLNFRILFGYK